MWRKKNKIITKNSWKRKKYNNVSNRKHRNIPKNNNKRRKDKLIVFDSNPAIKKITGNKRKNKDIERKGKVKGFEPARPELT